MRRYIPLYRATGAFWTLAVVISLTTGCVSGQAASTQLTHYDPTLEVGLAVPQGWRKLTSTPKGYPEDDFRFGWKRQIGNQIAVISVLTHMLVVDNEDGTPATSARMSQINAGKIIDALRPAFEEHFQQRLAEVTITMPRIAGHLALRADAKGAGNGIVIDARYGRIPTYEVWCAVPYRGQILLIQFGAPLQVADLLLPDFEYAISSLSFGTPPGVSSIPPSGVTDEQLLVRMQNDARPPQNGIPENRAPLIAVSPPATGENVRERKLLAEEQWTQLEAIARAQGIDVGALLRQIVDEFLKRIRQGNPPNSGGSQP